MNLVRCSISRAVIGSPLTTTTKFWARAEFPAAVARQIAAKANVRFRANNGNMSIIFVFGVSYPPAGSHLRRTTMAGARSMERSGESSCKTGSSNTTTRGGKSLTDHISADCAQAKLEHERVIVGGIRVVGVLLGIIDGQNNAIVNVSDAETRRAYHLSLKVIHSPTEDLPVRKHLELRAPLHTLARRQESECRLRGIMAVQERRAPTLYIGRSLELSPLQRKVILIEAELRRESEGRVGLVSEPSDIVRDVRIKSAIESRIGRPPDCERVLTEQVVRLSEYCIHIAAAVELSSITDASVQAAATLHPVPTGILVDPE